MKGEKTIWKKYETIYNNLPDELQDKFVDYLYNMDYEVGLDDAWYNSDNYETEFEIIVKDHLKDFLIDEHNRVYLKGEKPFQVKQQIRNSLKQIGMEMDL